MNSQQLAGIGNVNQFATAAQPFLNQAAGYANAAAAPINANTIAQYQSPYTQQVVNATEQQFNQQNQQQQSQLTANAAQQGALGGNRVGVAQGTLAGQQQMAEAPVIAGLYNQGYGTALQTALAEQQNLGNAAYSLGNIGTATENAGLAGAGAQIGAGTLEQQTQQASDIANYQQFQNQNAYPFQTTQWLAGIDTGVGSQMGGTSSTTAPAPSLLGQLAGLGIAGAGIVGGTGGFGANGWLTSLMASDERVKEDIQKVGHTNDGQPIYRFRYKGDPKWQIGLMAQEVERKHPEAVHNVAGLGMVDYKAATDDAVDDHPRKGLATGGVPGEPWSGGISYVPHMQITSGHGAPSPPAPWHDPTADNLTKGATGIAGLFNSGSSFGGFNYGDSDLAAAAKAGVESGLQFNPVTGDVFKRGGGVRARRPMVAGFGTGGMVRPHLADGGSDFEDRWGGASDFSEPSPGIVPAQDGLSFSDRFNGYAAPDADADYSMEKARRLQALATLTTNRASPGSGLGLGDVVSSYAPGFENNLGIDDSRASYNEAVRQSGDRYEAAGAAAAPADFVNASSVNGQPQNLTGPIIPPGGFGPAPDLPDAVNVGDTRPAGLAGAAAYAPEASGAAPAGSTEGQSSGLSPAFWTALTAAGLGMMSSRSPFPGVAIGEGGLKGLSSYAESQQAEEKRKKTEADIEHGRKQLEQTAQHYQQQLQLETKKLQQQEEDRQESRALRLQQLEQGKFSLIPGMGQGPDGQQVPGSYRLNTKTGEQTFMPGVVQTPKTAQSSEPTLSPETRRYMARAYLAGDSKQMQNLGRGAQGAANVVALREDIRAEAERQGMSPEQAAVKAAEFQGLAAGERTLGQRTANIEMAVNEASNFAGLAEQKFAALPRTSWVPVNKLIEGWNTGIYGSGPQAEAASAVNSFLNAYVRAISPTGVPTDNVRNHAYAVLNTAMSPEAFSGSMNTLKQEMDLARKSPEQVKEKFRQMYGAQGGNAAPAATGPAAGASAFTGRTATNPQTGQRMREIAPNQWAPF